MTPRKKKGLLSLGAIALLLVGCTADPGAAPTPPPSSDAAAPTPAASPTPSLTPLAAPDELDGEIARAVHTPDGPGGVPQTTSEALGVPDGAVEYTAEVMCVPAEPGARFAFSVTTAGVDDHGDVVLEADDECRGVPFRISSVTLADGLPVQLLFTELDGVSGAWARIVPTESLPD